MKKSWQVFLYEYTRHVLRKRFIFGLLSIPLFIGVIMLVSVLAILLTSNKAPIGYVDQSGVLANPLPLPKQSGLFDQQVPMLAYSNEAEARQALENDKIQAYFVLEPDYLQTSQARLVYLKEPDSSIQNQFRDFLRINLLAGQPAAIAKRLNDGSQFIIQSMDGSRQAGGNQWLSIIVPLAAGFLFIIVIMTSGGYLLHAVVEEKENRTIEIVVTSLSPGQLMAGKVAGNICVGLTQILFWIFLALVGVSIGSRSLAWVKNLDISPQYIFLILATLIPSFVMIAGLMAAVGSTVTELREASQISGLFTLPIMAPIYLFYPLISNPNGTLALVLSFFPLTAPVTLPLRAGFTVVPTPQLILNLLVLVVSAAGSVWLAGRTFRLGMLRYGKRVTLREIFSRSA